MRTFLSAEIIGVCLLSVVDYCHGSCTYIDLNTDLNNCIAAATPSSTARWFFPHGTIADQAQFCLKSGTKSTLATCINNIFSACKLEAKSLKMFDITGDNLINAYTNLCSATLITEAQACISVVSATSTFTMAETAFINDVTALPDTASSIQICGLAMTMEYVAYSNLLTATCTDSTHLAVWNSFFTTIVDTYVCTCGQAAMCKLSHVVLRLTFLVASYFMNRVLKT